MPFCDTFVFMNENFDVEKAKQFLKKRELAEREERERQRKIVLTSLVNHLKTLFSNTDVEVFLVGSITQPYMFYPRSDIDIVVKNFQDDRFDLTSQIESLISRNVEIIIFENCHFQDHVIKYGIRVI